MPTYDYVCDACEHAFEEFQMMSAKVLKKCPECGKAKLRRLIGTGAGVIFKGGGFYETDYRSDAYQKDAKADKPSDGKSEGGKDGGSEKSSGDGGPGKSSGEGKTSDTKPAAKAEKPSTKKSDSKPSKKND